MTWKRPNRLRAVRESDASKSIAEVYTDIRSVLGVAHVHPLFQMYAAIGPFFLHLWSVMKPVLRTAEFVNATERLRADAYTRIHSYFEIPDLGEKQRGSTSDIAELVNTIDLFQYEDGALLLLLSVLAESFDNPIGKPGDVRQQITPERFSLQPVLIDDEVLAPDTKKLFDEIRRQFGLGVVPVEFRALARWPHFLNDHWQVWKHISESPVLDACEHQLMQHSIELAHNLPGPIEISSTFLEENGIGEDEFSAIVRFTHNWNRALTTLLLQISAAKISMEGGTAMAQPRKEAPAEAVPPRAA